MVFLLLLGGIDLLAAAVLTLSAFGIPLPHLQAALGLGLIGKGAMFITDVLSMLDVILGIAMFVLLWVEMPTVALCMAGYLAVKGLCSFA